MMVTMLGTDYQYANAPVSTYRLGNGYNRSCGLGWTQGPSGIADEDLWQYAESNAELQAELDRRATSAIAADPSGWQVFSTELREWVDRGLGTWQQWMSLQEAEVTNETQQAQLATIGAMMQAGLTPSQVGSMGGATPWLIGGGLAIAGAVVVLLVMNQPRRRRR